MWRTDSEEEVIAKASPLFFQKTYSEALLFISLLISLCLMMASKLKKRKKGLPIQKEMQCASKSVKRGKVGKGQQEGIVAKRSTTAAILIRNGAVQQERRCWWCRWRCRQA